MNGKTPLLLSLVLAAVLAGALLFAQPYSLRSGPPSPWRGYVRPAQLYMEAALRHDSIALVRRSAAAAPVSWILGLAREQPDSLAHWADEARVWTGSRHGDTTEILLHQPIWFRFVGSDHELKVAEAGWQELKDNGFADVFPADSLLR
jgi:hypothetical protein